MTKDNKSKTGEANVVEPSSSRFKKRKRSVGKAKAKPKKKQVQSKKKSTTTDKVKGKCFHCDKVSHWKRNCLQYLEDLFKKMNVKGKSDLLVIESCLVEDESSPWIVDSRATNHVCSCLQWTDSWTELKEEAFSIRIGIGDVVSARVVGETIPSQITLPPKRSGRVVRQPDRYLGIGKAQGVVSDNSLDDPLSFKHAMGYFDKEEWLKAMNLEMESMYSNSV
ncbi:hypothetical protein LWI29_015615 [Acer saccharum]|uniref:Uncharacterized protein n=1 Tax=Acer saccharum TaxID=4024 RepID=A0AA39SDR0_ACESA|nr:hypothetical protein LWI29_015615 [Acer saccharum]